jgi:hypothetical protein
LSAAAAVVVGVMEACACCGCQRKQTLVRGQHRGHISPVFREQREAAKAEVVAASAAMVDVVVVA